MSRPTTSRFSQRRRQLLFGSLLFGTSFAALALRVRSQAVPIAPGTLSDFIPKTIGTYRYASAGGLIMPPEGELSAILYSDICTRVYIAPSKPPIMMVIAYGAAQDAMLSLHRPEECYPFAGFDISPIKEISLSHPMPEGAKGNFLTARREDRLEHIFYWVRIGKQFPTSLLRQRLTVASYNLEGKSPLGLLTRLSIVGGDASSALSEMEAFNADLIDGLDAKGRELMLDWHG